MIIIIALAICFLFGSILAAMQNDHIEVKAIGWVTSILACGLLGFLL